LNSLPVTEDKLRSCYFFYGEEPFLARQFIDKLEEILFSDKEEARNVEKFCLEESSWAEIIDTARTVPFFSSRRIITVEVANAKKTKPSSTDEKILREYFQSCSNQTILVIIFSGKVKKGSPLVRLFASLPSSVVSLEEIKPLKDRNLMTWMETQFRHQGKEPAVDALKRLADITGNDLSRINNEIEKIVVFVGEKTRIELDDINQISGWVKSFFEWEIADNLERGDYKQSLIVLDKLLNKEGTKPEYVLGSFSKFFSNILLAKLLLVEKHRDRKAIFKEFKPQIREKFGRFYTRKFNEFFALVESLSLADLDRFLGKLEDIDLKLKTTSLSLQTQLEGFLYEYCRFRGEDRVIARGRR
jgi:DNA polymerase III delta subunit